MVKTANRRAARKPVAVSQKSAGNDVTRPAGKKSKARGRRWLLWVVICVLVIGACTLYVYTSTPKKIAKKDARSTKQTGQANVKESKGKAKIKKQQGRPAGKSLEIQHSIIFLDASRAVLQFSKGIIR